MNIFAIKCLQNGHQNTNDENDGMNWKQYKILSSQLLNRFIFVSSTLIRHFHHNSVMFIMSNKKLHVLFTSNKCCKCKYEMQTCIQATGL